MRNAEPNGEKPRSPGRQIALLAVTVALLGAFVFGAVPGSVAGTEAGNWSQFRGDDANTGSHNGTGPTSVTSSLWVNSVAGSGYATEPVVRNETVYVGNTDNRFRAFYASNGSVKWTALDSVSGAIYSTSTVRNGTIFVGTNQGSGSGKLHALNTEDGSINWSFTADDDVRSSPVYRDNTVYVGSGTATVSPDDTKLYAINATDGTERWNFSTGDVIEQSSPAVEGDTVYVGSHDNNLYAINRTTGNKRWSATTGSSIKGSPAVKYGTVYVGSQDGSVYAFNTTNGNQNWSFTTGGPVQASPAVRNDTVFIGSLDDTFYAINATDGTQRYSYNSGHASDVSTPTVVGDIVYFGNGEHIIALHAWSGTELWQYDSGDVGGFAEGVTVVNDRLYATEGQDLHAITDGELEINDLTLDNTTENANTTYTLNFSVTRQAIENADNIVIDASDAASAGVDFSTLDDITLTTSSGSTVTASAAATSSSVSVFGIDSRLETDAGAGPYTITIANATSPYTGTYGVDVDISNTTAGTLASDSTTFTTTGDWPQFGYNETNRRWTPLTGPRSTAVANWTFGTSNAIASSPAIVDDTAYFGSNDSTVYAVNTTNGNQQWSFTTGGKVTSSPAVINDTVFVGSHDGKVYAIHVSNGTSNWTYTTGGAVQSAPTFDDGTVYVGSDDDNVYALDAQTGAKEWSYTAGGDVDTPPAVYNDSVIVSSEDGTTQSLYANNGTREWNFLPGPVYSQTVAGGDVYVGSGDDNLYSVDIEEFTIEWKYTASAPVKTSAAVVNDTVYFGSSDNNVYAVNAEDGSLNWSSTTGGSVVSSPAVANDTVYVGSDDSNVYALDRTTGSQRWTYSTGASVRSSPAVVDGALYVGSDDTNLYALKKPYFNVTVENTSGQVKAGETATVTTTVTNTGGAADTQDITLDVNGSQEDSVTGLNLAAGESRVVTLQYTATSGDIPTIGATVATANESKSRTLTVINKTDWPQFGVNATNLGVNYGTGPQDPVGELWNTTVGGPIDVNPAVVNGTVYVGSLDGTVYALDASTGTKQWSYTTGAPIHSSPAVVNGTVYVGSRDNKLYALDAATGTKQWSYTTGGWIDSSPAVANGTVYVGSYDNNVYALDAATGTKKWSYATGGHVSSSPALVDGTVYVGSNDKNVYALDASTGTKQWSHATGHIVESSPTVISGTVYVGRGDVYALDASTGTEQWSYAIGGDVSSPAVVSGTVYVGNTFVDTVYALDASTGSEQWSYTTGNGIYAAPAVVNGTVYVGSADNNVYALDASTGSEQWSYATEDHVRSRPTVVNGTVYVGSADDNLYALRERANFTVTVDSVTGQVKPGETVTVNATINNTGGLSGTQDITFSVNGTQKASNTSVTLDEGESVTESFTYTATSGDIPTLGVSVATDNETVNRTVTVIDQTDWPQFGVNETNRGVNYGTGPTTNVTADWTFGTFDPYTSPAVVDGTIYVGNTFGDKVFAIDADTGTKQWKQTVGGTVRSTVAVANGTVYFGSDDHNVYALDADTGTEQWSYTTGANVQSSPVVVNGTVYIGSNDDYMYALDAETGTKQWRTQFARDVGGPAVVNGTVYVGSNTGDNKVYALDANTGAEKWSYTAGDGVDATPAVHDDTVYVGSSDNKLYALNASTGSKKWDYATGNRIDSSPAVGRDTVYVTSADGNLYALDATTGTKLWSHSGANELTSPALVGDTVYLGSGDHNVYALDADTGTERWRYATGNDIDFSSPAVVDGTLYVGSRDEKLYALKERNYFDLTVDSINASVTSGETIEAKVTITNTGDFSGTQGITFSVNGTQQSVGTGTTLGAGESVTKSFTYSTNDTDTPAVRLGISTANQTVQRTVDVDPLILDPDVTLSTTALAFGNVSVGERASGQLTIGNDGDATLSVSSISVSDPAFVPGADSLSILPGETGTVNVEFEPTAVGNHSSTLVVESDDPDESQRSVTLSGTGVDSEFTRAPTAVSFGNVSVGEAVTRQVTVGNNGTGALDAVNVSLTGSDAGNFSTGADEFGLGAGENNTLAVTYRPTATGTQNATLVFENETGGTLGTVALNGTGVAGGFAASGTVTFGNVTVNTSVERTLAVQNTGTGPLTVSNVSLAGTNASLATANGSTGSAFAVGVDGLSVPAGENRTVPVTFAPRTSGTVNATLRFAGGPNETVGTVNLTARGVEPVLETTETVAFGNVTVGSGVAQNVTVRNAGSGTLVVDNVTIAGVNTTTIAGANATFAVGDPQFELAPGAETTVPVRFAPSSAGAENATLAFSNGGTRLATISVTGTGVAGEFTADERLAFGNVSVQGTTTANVTVGNNGTGILIVENASIAGANGTFATTLDRIELAPGTQRELAVAFRPTERRQYEATLTLGASGQRLGTVNLTGTGGESALTATAIDFGNVSVNGTSTETVSITNAGNATVPVENISVTGTNAAEFRSETDPFTLGPGDTETVTVTFDPSETGRREAMLTAETGGTELATVSLTGDARETLLGVDRGAVTFSPVTVGNETTETLSVTTRVDADVPVTNVEVVGRDADVFDVGVTEGVVTANDTLSIPVTFGPERAGAARASLAIERSNGTRATTIPLRGTGQAPRIAVTPESVTFDDLRVDEQTSEQLVVSNTGNATLAVTDVTFGSAAGPFSISESAFELAPGQNRTLTVEFDPEIERERSTTLLIRSTDPRNPTTAVWVSSGRVRATVTIDEQNQTTTTQATVSNVSAGQATAVDLPDAGTVTAEPTNDTDDAEETNETADADNETADADNETAAEEPVDDGYTVEQVSVTPKNDTDLSVNITSSTSRLNSTPETTAGFENGTRQLGNLSAETNIPDENIEEVELTFRVNREAIENLDSDPGNVSMYRFNETREAWVEKRTGIVNMTEDQVVLNATGSGFSEWTAAAKRPEFSITDTSVSVRATTTEEEVTIQVIVTNSGGTDGQYEADLLQNESVIKSKSATVADGGTAAITFERQFSNPGLYELKVNDVFAGEVDISQEDRDVDVRTPTGSDVQVQANDPNETDETATPTGSDGGGLPLGLLAGLAVIVLLGAVGVWYAQRGRVQTSAPSEDSEPSGENSSESGDETSDE